MICGRVKWLWGQFLSENLGYPVSIIGPILYVQSFIIWLMDKGLVGAPPQIHKKIMSLQDESKKEEELGT
jgi:hypothetical protein